MIAMRRTLTIIALVSSMALAASTPGWAQSNSPAGNQPSQSVPDTQSGGPSGGANSGGDDTAGNRTQPGGAGATGGGAATEKAPDGGGGAGKALVGLLVVLAIGGAIALVSISRRKRGADQQLDSAGKA